MDRLRNFGFLLKDVSRRYVLRFEQRAREIALTLAQCRALVHLEKNEGISQARLADLADVEPMAMVRILDHMEADGLLERRPDPADRRARSIYLTRKAKPVLDRIWRMSELTRAETFGGITVRQREAFMAALERMHANVCALDGQPVESTRAVTRARAGTPVNGARRPPKPRTRKPRTRGRL